MAHLWYHPSTMAVRILVNLSGHISKGVRRETWNGRRYIVAPITMIVPGVLPGSQGALLYPSQEVARNARDWDGIAITVNHPSDPISNHHLSARSQGVWKRQGIGRVRNTVFNGKLRCEGWFDEERTRRIDPRIVTALLNNKTMEVSTGLYTDNEPQRGEWNGRQYDFIARNYRPDHLAVLPDQVGACSRQDGCGIHVNANPEGHNQYTEQNHKDVKAAMMSRKDYVKLQTSKAGEERNAKYHGLMHKNAVARALAIDGISLKTALKHYSDIESHPQSGKHYTKRGPKAGEIESNSKCKCGGTCDECATDNANPEGHNQYTTGGGFHAHDKGTLRARAGINEYRIGFDSKSGKHVVATARVRPNGKLEKPSSLGSHDTEDAAKAAVTEHAHSKGRELIGNATDEQGMTKNMRRSFWRWFGEAMGLTKNAFPQRSDDGKFGQAPLSQEDAADAEAAERGESRKELEQDERPSKKKAPIGNKREKCPECGGDMEDGECDECGYVENQVGSRAVGAARRSVAIASATAKLKKKDGAVEADEEDDNTSAARDESQDDIERDGATQNKDHQMRMNWLELLSHDPRLTTNMPAGGAFSGAKAAGYSAGQAAAMAGKLEGSYDKEGADSGPSKEAKQASEHAERTKSKSAHKAAASAHRDAAEHHENEGNTEHAAAHKSAARSHAAKAAKMARNQEYTVNWMALISNDPQLTCNMPAGGAFSGAKAAGFSAAQAAAMAGKLEGSYDKEGADSGPSKEAKEASAHAEKTKSKSAHKKAAEAHKDAAEHHENEGNTEHAAAHKSAARSHAAKAARMSRNEASGIGGGDIQAGGEEDADGDDDPSDYESDAGNLDPNKSKKKAKMPTGNSEVQNYANELYNREKKQLVQQLTANMRDPSRKQLAVRRFSQKGLGELRELIELLPPTGNVRRRAPSPEEDSDYAQNYLGAGIVVGNERRTDNATNDDLLEAPTINFADCAAENFGRKDQRRQA